MPHIQSDPTSQLTTVIFPLNNEYVQILTFGIFKYYVDFVYYID